MPVSLAGSRRRRSARGWGSFQFPACNCSSALLPQIDGEHANEIHFLETTGIMISSRLSSGYDDVDVASKLPNWSRTSNPGRQRDGKSRCAPQLAGRMGDVLEEVDFIIVVFSLIANHRRFGARITGGESSPAAKTPKCCHPRRSPWPRARFVSTAGAGITICLLQLGVAGPHRYRPPETSGLPDSLRIGNEELDVSG